MTETHYRSTPSYNDITESAMPSPKASSTKFEIASSNRPSIARISYTINNNLDNV